MEVHAGTRNAGVTAPPCNSQVLPATSLSSVALLPKTSGPLCKRKGDVVEKNASLKVPNEQRNTKSTI